MRTRAMLLKDNIHDRTGCSIVIPGYLSDTILINNLKDFAAEMEQNMKLKKLHDVRDKLIAKQEELKEAKSNYKLMKKVNKATTKASDNGNENAKLLSLHYPLLSKLRTTSCFDAILQVPSIVSKYDLTIDKSHSFLEHVPKNSKAHKTLTLVCNELVQKDYMFNFVSLYMEVTALTHCIEHQQVWAVSVQEMVQDQKNIIKAIKKQIKTLNEEVDAAQQDLTGAAG